MGVLPRDCVYIGDQPTDIQAAQAAGMRGIAALWGDGEQHRMEPLRPIGMARTPHDILALMGADD